MKNLYNKGQFRSREYAKHIRPFLKRKGNKRWRRPRITEVKNQLENET